MNKEEKELIEKKPSIIQRILDFLFPSKKIETINEVEEEIKEAEEVVEEEEEFEDLIDETEMVEDDVSDYTKEDIIKLQEDYESNQISIDSLTENQTNLLFTLYLEQIKELAKSNEEKKKKLLEYKKTMNNE